MSAATILAAHSKAPIPKSLKLTIPISKETIARGTRRSPRNCPIAIALQAHFLPTLIVSVNTRDSHFFTAQTTLIFTHSIDMLFWIHNFDGYSRVEPISLQIDLQAQTIAIVEFDFGAKTVSIVTSDQAN